MRGLRWIAAVLVLAALLAGCASKPPDAGDGRDSPQLARIEIYAAGDPERVRALEDENSLRRFEQALSAPESESADSPDRQEELRQSLEGREVLYLFAAYKAPVAVLNDGALEKVYEATLYRDSNVIRMQVPPSVVKSTPIPADVLVFHEEISNDAVDALLDLAQ